MTVDKYLAAMGPSDNLQQHVRQTVQSAVERAMKQIEIQQHRRELRMARFGDAVESVIAKNSKACIASAWGELAAPVRLRREKAQQAEIAERRRMELELLAERQRRTEADKRRREEEEAKQKAKEAEWDAKRARLSKELVERTGVYGAKLPRNLDNVETLEDIPSSASSG